MAIFSGCTCGEKWRDEIYFILRVVTGFIFVYHGYTKIFGMGLEATTGFFSSVGIPAAGLVAYIVAYGEFLGGIALILGFMTHWIAKLNILIILGAIYFVHLSNGYNGMEGGYEYQLLILAVNLFIMVYGSGAYSIDRTHHKAESQ
jgi:putative oxidoreductase